jgi:deoxyribose-phosphate aldolase
MPLELDWIRDARVNRSAVERRAESLPRRRTVKREWQLGWLVRAVTVMDLTTLSGDDTAGRVHRLCAKARQPIRRDLLEQLGFADRRIHVAAVCVYHAFVAAAARALAGTGIPIAAVSTGFPAGLTPMPQRLAEIAASVSEGAGEIDVVITRSHVFGGEWDRLYAEVRAMREACGEAHLKTILAAGELGTFRDVYRASLVCMMAGADFIKTSTGKESINATLPIGLVMARAIRAYRERTGYLVGLKPAGGIRRAKEALDWLVLVKEELGDRYLRPDLFRLGASTLLTDLERQLEFHLTGRYSAAHRHGLG